MRGISKEAPRTLSPGYSGSRRVFVVILLLMAGLVFAGLGIFDFIPSDYDKNGMEATAIIQTLDGGPSGFPTVQFEVDGVSYEGEIPEYNSTMVVGGTLEIRYMKENPDDFALAKGQSAFSYIYIAFGAMIIISSVLIFISNGKKSLKRIYKIKQNGTLVKCCLSGFSVGNFVESRSTAYGSTTGNAISCTITCKDSKGLYYSQKNFVSDIAVDYSKPNFGYKLGDSINVYISNENPNKFAIDVVEYQERKVMESYNKQNRYEDSDF